MGNCLIVLSVDDDDYRDIELAITQRQLRPRDLPPGKSNLAGKYIAEICRAFIDYRAERSDGVS